LIGSFEALGASSRVNKIFIEFLDTVAGITQWQEADEPRKALIKAELLAPPQREEKSFGQFCESFVC
jgi:hypothetical protein